MHAAAALEDAYRIDAGNPAAGKKPREKLRDHFVLAVIETAHHHSAIADVEIDVAERQRIAIGILPVRRCVDNDDFEVAPLRILRGFQDGDVFRGTLVIGVALVRLPMRQHDARRGKAGQRVDMPVRTARAGIGNDTTRQPDRMPSAEQPVAFSLDFRLRPVRIAIGVELHRFRQQQRTLAVDMNAAALVDKLRRQPPCVGHFGHGTRDQRIVFRLGKGTPAPAVESPVDGTKPAIAPDHECRTAVAEPAVSDWPLDRIDAVREIFPRLRGLTRRHDHGDGLEPDDRARRGRPCAPSPLWIVLQHEVVAWPCHPRSRMRRPLRRHPEIQNR